MKQAGTDDVAFEDLPYFIAVNYQRLLEAKTTQEQVKIALHTYNLGLRALTLGLVSQYLIRNRDTVKDKYLTDLLEEKFPERMTLDAWQKVLFATLRAYEGERALFFMPELYDFYWDTSSLPHRQRSEVEEPFERLTQIAVGIQTEKVIPQNEAEWKILADEVTSLLRQVLQSIAFIGKYDLIRVLDCDAQFYQFELHKGFKITVERRALPQTFELAPGHFYLRDGTEKFLPLDLFLVFWEGQSASTELSTRDIGIYDKLIYEQLQYLLAGLGTTIVDNENGRRFIELFYNIIEDVKRQRETAEKLNWWQLRDICADITHQRMATVARKYQRELYLQRKKTREAFERFLRSKERCFVLTGKSGVGKSNFFLALSEELQRSRNDVCVLMYDGGNLKVEPSVTAVISQDFDNRLVLAGQRINEVWREIAKIEGIQDRLAILCVDAINENSQAKELLRQLDELAQSPWPWLKIVFSSRPETWQTIKRGVRLSDNLYYREENAEILGVELEPFSYSEQMEPFSGQELPAAYARYQEVFKLQTAYENIPGEMRRMLRDPLNLWLVASTRKGQAIPETLKVTELVESYVDAFVQTEDRRLLEERLVPLMVQERHYTNALTVANIDAVGGGLYESIYSEQVLSDGRQVNQSFLNLLDMDILAQQTEGREKKIAFKYERFYEYFVGKALYKSLKSERDWQGQYAEWLAQLLQTPFLWGAIKSCLEQQIRALSAESCSVLGMQLAQIDNQRMKEILIAALTEYGQDNRAKTQQVLGFMLEEKRGWWQALMRRETMTTQCPAWKQVAIVVASNLGLSEPLELALTDPTPAVRAVAMRHAYIFWRREREAGFGILERLVDRSTGSFGIPRASIFESCIGLSLLILFGDLRNSETTSRLRSIWHRAIERLLWINTQKQQNKPERLKASIRTTLIRLFAGFVIRTAGEVPSNSMLNIPELKQFFQHDGDWDRRRQVLRTLIRYLDTNTTNIQRIRDELMMLAPERDMLISLLAFAVLQKHNIVNPEATIPLVTELFNRSIEVDPPGPFAGAVSLNVYLLEAKQYWDDRTWDNIKAGCLNRMMTYLDHFQGKWWTNLREHRFNYIDLITMWEAGGPVDAPISRIAKQYVEQMITKRDYIWLKDIIEWELTFNAIEHGRLRFTFSVLEMVIDIHEPAVSAAIIELLARMRVYYPDEVDNFMEVNELEEQFMAAVHANTSSETIGDLLNMRVFRFWVEVIVLGNAPAFWNGLLQVLQQLPESRNLEQFSVILLKFFINQIYGDAVFPDVPV